MIALRTVVLIALAVALVVLVAGRGFGGAGLGGTGFVAAVFGSVPFALLLITAGAVLLYLEFHDVDTRESRRGATAGSAPRPSVARRQDGWVHLDDPEDASRAPDVVRREG